MRGRTLAAILGVLLALATAGQTVRWHDRSTASRLLAEVEALSMQAALSGQVPAPLIASNLQALRRAAPLDPVEVGIPIARGSQYLLLSRAAPAIEAYQESLDLEPRAEGYLDLGRAQWLAGQTDEARRSFGLAVRLDPHFASLVPPGGSLEGR
jgi:tetratricopeptide (TPR) repeat protein